MIDVSDRASCSALIASSAETDMKMVMQLLLCPPEDAGDKICFAWTDVRDCSDNEAAEIADCQRQNDINRDKNDGWWRSFQ